MQTDGVAPLFQRIVTHQTLKDNTDEITFPAPVCITSVTIGAVPGAAQRDAQPFITVFARDSRTCGSARFACLYEGLHQPAAGVATAQLQPFITEHVVIRGRYQTVPLSIHGYSLARAAAGSSPPSQPIPLTIDDALPRFEELVQDLPSPPPPPVDAAINFATDAAPAIEPLLKYWRAVGAVPRRIIASPPPEEALRGAMAAAEIICNKLAAGAASAADDSAEPQDGTDDHELVNMAMGWLGFLAEIPSPLAAAKEVGVCGSLGLAVAVLVCTRPRAAVLFCSRDGQLLLSEALASPRAPKRNVRHAAAAALLLAHANGALGCEALLGWWQPSFVQWTVKAGPSPVKKGQRSSRTPGGGAGERRGYRAREDEEMIPQVDGAWDTDGGGAKSHKRRRKIEERMSRPPAPRGAAAAVDPDDRWDGGADAAGIGVEYDDYGGESEKRAAQGSEKEKRLPERDSGKAEKNERRRDKEEHRHHRRSSRGHDDEASDRRRRPIAVPPGKEKEAEKERERGREREKEREDKHARKREEGGGGRKKRPLAVPPAALSPDPRIERARKQREDSEDSQYQHLSTKFWEARKKVYAGVYAAVAAALVELQLGALAGVGTRLMRVLRFYERAAAFSIAAEELFELNGEGKQQAAVPPKDAVAAAVAKCAGSLAHLGEALADGESTHRTPTPAAVLDAEPAAGLCAPPPPRLSATFLETLDARGVLRMLPAVLHVPTIYRTKLEHEDRATAAAGAADAANMAAAMLSAAAPLLAALTSCAAGLRTLAAATGLVELLLAALRAASLESSRDGSGGPAVLALESLVVASAAVEDLCAAESFESDMWTSAAVTLRNFLAGGPSLRLPALLAASLIGNRAFLRCAEAVSARCAVLMEAGGSGLAAASSSEPLYANENVADGSSTAGKFASLVAAMPQLGLGSELLVALSKEAHPGVVSRWVPAAQATLRRLTTLGAALCVCPAPGSTAAFTSVEALCGALEAAAVLETGQLPALIASLTADLPQLALPPTDAARMGGDGSGLAEDGLAGVEWAAVREFWDDPRRRGRAEAALRLTTCLLWQPAGRAAAAALHLADGLRVLLRAILAGAEAFTAAQVDRQWVSRAGAAIDPVASAANKRAAAEFLGAAAAAASSWLQLSREAVAVNSAACAAALFKAHAALSVDEDSLLCMLGTDGPVAGPAAAATAPLSPVLVARRHVTAALRCWLEGTNWGPPPLPLVLLGSKQAQQRHSARFQAQALAPLAPSQLFSATCALGDLFPPEWPLPGRRDAQPPPSERKYRLALAQAIEGCQAGFDALVRACVAAEPTLLRAATARLLARAAGLGGGMGPFLVQPIVAALDAAGASQTPAHDARKLLELLVPLVYRPALKAAMLDAAAPSTLANIIRVMSTPSPAIEPADAAAVCTMAVECLVVLCNPALGLNPLATAEQAAIEEVPTESQGTAVAAVLLEHLPALGANAVLAQRVLRQMTETPPGRAALRRGAATLHAAATGQPPPPPSELKPAAVVAAAQWVATKYWGLAQQAQQAGAPALSAAFSDVSEGMKGVVATMEGDSEKPPTQPPPAPLRFAAATQAATAAATKAGLDPDAEARQIRWSDARAAEGAATDVHDAVTRMFWKNCRARSVQQTASGTAAALKHYTRRTCMPDEGLTVEATLHPPLTHPVRPFKEEMAAEPPSAVGAAVGVISANANGNGAAALPAASMPGMLHDVAVAEQRQQVPSALGMAGQEGASGGVEAAAIDATQLDVTVAIATIPVAPVAAIPDSFDLYSDLGADPLGEMLMQPPASAAADALKAAAVTPVPTAGAAPMDVADIYADFGPELGEPSSQSQPAVAEKAEKKTAVAEPAEAAEEAAVEERREQAEEEGEPAAPMEVEEAEEKGEEESQMSRKIKVEENEALPPPAAAAPPAGGIDISALLADPSAVQALMKDPARLQALLLKNPALLQVLKAKLNK